MNKFRLFSAALLVMVKETCAYVIVHYEVEKAIHVSTNMQK